MQVFELLSERIQNSIANIRKVSEEQKTKFRNEPETYLKYRKEVEHELNTRFKFVCDRISLQPTLSLTQTQIIKDGPEQAEAVKFSVNQMRSKLGDNSPLIKYIIPDFAVGCRRPTPGNGYLEALTKDNVRVVTESISEIVPEGIRLASGEIITVDIFICATGFDISFRPRYPVRGIDGITLAEQWKTKPDGYLSLAVPNFPNHFSKSHRPIQLELTRY